MLFSHVFPRIDESSAALYGAAVGGGILLTGEAQPGISCAGRHSWRIIAVQTRNGAVDVRLPSGALVDGFFTRGSWEWRLDPWA